MTAEELLTKIKNGLGITGNYQDAALQTYVDEVKAFMLSAGVSTDVVESEAAVGCIMRGVADLWNYGSGNASLSQYFKMRLLQLKKKEIIIESKIADYTEVIEIQGQTSSVTFTKPADLPSEYITEVYVNGILDENGKQYSLSDNVISFTGILTAGTRVTVKLYYLVKEKRGTAQ